MRVAALGVDAPVVREEVDGRGALSLPQDPRTVGWWGAGAAPGAPVGTIVLAGHVDSEQQGAGALYPLARTPVGARVVVSGPGGEATYVVQGRRRYAKDALPWRDLFRQDVEARLLLVTCGGDFDQETRHYSDNVVVYAVPLGAASPSRPDDPAAVGVRRLRPGGRRRAPAPREEPAPSQNLDGRYATIPCGSMTYFLAAPWSKRW